jgi:flagellar protein FlaG
VNSAAEAFGAYLQQHQQELVFQVDQATGETVFRIVNAKTKEVIRQVPSEDILVMARKLRELDHSKGASGVLVDKVG